VIYILLVFSIWLTSWSIWKYYLRQSDTKSMTNSKIEKEIVEQNVQIPSPIIFEFYDDIKNDSDEDPPTVVMPLRGSLKNKL